MEFHRIQNITDKWYRNFYDIYAVSFPLHEQRNKIQQTEAFENVDYHLDVLIQENRLLSFIAYWEFESYCYIEHFAVHPDARGMNVGTKTLQAFIEMKQKTVLLEIDPLTDETARKRYRFYEHFGFRANEYQHLHPAYNKKFAPHELIVLSYPGLLTATEYNSFYTDLKGIVMR